MYGPTLLLALYGLTVAIAGAAGAPYALPVARPNAQLAPLMMGAGAFVCMKFSTQKVTMSKMIIANIAPGRLLISLAILPMTFPFVSTVSYQRIGDSLQTPQRGNPTEFYDSENHTYCAASETPLSVFANRLAPVKYHTVQD